MGNRPRLLDLFCGAGGAAMGYHRAGFDVVGIDIATQPHYPFEFYQADAIQVLEQEMAWIREGFDAIHASPPCQAHVKGLAAVNRAIGREYDHADLIAPTRRLLRASGLPYVIENVVGAPLENPIRLCGSSFGLDVERHRLFECSFAVMATPCAHHIQEPDRFWTADGRSRRLGQRARVAQVYGNGGETHRWGPAMGIDWMSAREMAEAIPPAYTEHIGEALMRSLEVAA